MPDHLKIVRAAKILPLANEKAAYGLAALLAPALELNDAVLIGKAKQTGSSDSGKNFEILGLETWQEFKRRANIGSHEILDLGEVTLAPALLNAHCHLELSQLTKNYSGCTKSGLGFVPWVKSLLALTSPPQESGQQQELSQQRYTQALAAAVGQLSDSYTVAVGDVGARNQPQVAELLALNGVSAHFFVECFGHGTKVISDYWVNNKIFMQSEHLAGQNLQSSLFMASLSGHSLYSSSVANLQMAKNWCKTQGRTFSLHLAEHLDEVEFLQTGQGALATLLAERVTPASFKAPYLSPVLAAEAYGLLDDKTLAVHCVHCSFQEIELMAKRKVFVALCPRSNEYIGVGKANFKALAESALCLCLGTDSLASNNDLSMINELYALKQLALEHKIELPLAALMRIASLNSAFALGFEKHFGSLEQGKNFCYSIFPLHFSFE